jgi:hypothetical protein
MEKNASKTAYIRCRTCGRYLPAQAAVRDRYCSETCAAGYSDCPTCGRYYPVGSGFRGRYCSHACAIQYRLNRTFGPEPVLVVSEEIE